MPPDSGKALCAKSLWHRLKLQRDDLQEIQDVIRAHCNEFDARDILSKIDDQMNLITSEIKCNFETWKGKITAELYGDQYKGKMEKRIIHNDDIFDNLVTLRLEKNNAHSSEALLFVRIKSTFDKSIFLQLAESVNWKRFSDFPLPNEASLLYDVKEELQVKKDAVGFIVDLFNDIVQEVEDERNKGLFLQIMQQLQNKMLPARNDLKWNNN